PSRERDGDLGGEPARHGLVDVASMEPSRERDGDKLGHVAKKASPLDVLQWSRRANATETRSLPRSRPPSSAASMEPSRERDGDIAFYDKSRQRFSQLQWSRRANATETMGFPLPRTRNRRASMEP